MTSHDFDVEPAPIRERGLIAAALMFGVYPGYWLVGPQTLGRPEIDVTLPIDRATPLVVEWMWVYVAVYLGALLPLAVVNTRQLFRRMALAYLIVLLTAFGVFALWPVRMTMRPAPDGIDVDHFAGWGLRLTYVLDQPYNCFPSLHVATATLAALVCWKADRLIGAFAGLGALAISASTMLVKQHYAADVVTGVLLAVLAWAPLVAPLPRPPTGSRRATVGLTAIYAAAIAAMYGLYLTGWVPGATR